MRPGVTSVAVQRDLDVDITSVHSDKLSSVWYQHCQAEEFSKQWSSQYKKSPLTYILYHMSCSNCSLGLMNILLDADLGFL